MHEGPSGEQRSASWVKAAVEVAKVATRETAEKPAKSVVVKLSSK